MKGRGKDDVRGGAAARPMAVAAGALALALAAGAGCGNRYLVGVGDAGREGGTGGGVSGGGGTGGAAAPFGTGGAAVVAGSGGAGGRGTAAGGTAGSIAGTGSVVGTGGVVVACGAPATSRGARPLALPGDEIAARLAEFLWRAPADAALLARTAAPSFLTSADVQALADEMLRDPRATAGADAFARQWLDLDRLVTVPAPADFPGLDDVTRADMVEEALRRFRWQAVEMDGTFQTLLVSGTTFLNDCLASLYGAVGIPVTGWTEVDLTRSLRVGVTTQLAWLTVHPRPTSRGIWIREHLFCEAVPPPPPGLQPVLPPNGDAAGTFSQQLVQATSPPACAGCHQLVDPMGFTYEPFDDAGRSRTDSGNFVFSPRGTSETLPSGDTIVVSSLLNLMNTLALACDAQRCFVNSWFATLPARLTANGVDAASVEAALGAFTDAGLRLSTLIAAITATPQFLAPTP